VNREGRRGREGEDVNGRGWMGRGMEGWEGGGRIGKGEGGGFDLDICPGAQRVPSYATACWRYIYCTLYTYYAGLRLYAFVL